MQPEDALTSIAEISITLAGFTGILVAIRTSGASGDRADLAARLVVVLVVPALVLVCALLPFGLSGFSSSPALVWGVPLILYSVVTGAMTTSSAVRVARGSLALSNPILGFSTFVVGALVLVIAFLSGVGLLLPYSPGLLVLVLIWSLLWAAYTLVTSVIFTTESPGA